MLRLGCVGDLLRFEKREIEVAAFAPDRSSPQSNRGDEAERTGSVRNLSTTMGHSTGLIREQCPVW